ncbi:hypothetical protein GCM10007082_21900 [Oceanisphaera arctica]|nr:hypothetical protein GCM10007082_21900 [Oceanisphaera arctica]
MYMGKGNEGMSEVVLEDESECDILVKRPSRQSDLVTPAQIMAPVSRGRGDYCCNSCSVKMPWNRAVLR